MPPTFHIEEGTYEVIVRVTEPGNYGAVALIAAVEAAAGYFLIIWGVSALCWVPLFAYADFHPSVLGEKDMGGAFIAAMTLVASGIAFLGGVLAMVLGLLRYLWLMWQYARVRRASRVL